MAKGNVYSRRLRSRKRSDSMCSEEEGEELSNCLESRDQHYGIYTPEPVQRTLILRSGDDLEEDDIDDIEDSEFEDLDGYEDRDYNRKMYTKSYRVEEERGDPQDIQEQDDKNMEIQEHQVQRSELKRRAAGAAACFKRPYGTRGLWQKVIGLNAMKMVLKYMRRLWRFMLRNSFMAVNVLWLLAPLCCFVVAVTVPHYVTSAIHYVDILSTKVIGARGSAGGGLEMEAMRSMVLEIVDLKVIGMTKEIRLLQQTVQSQEREIEALKLLHDSMRHAHDEAQKKFSLVEPDSAITLHVQKVVAEHTKRSREIFLDRTSQIQQDLRLVSTQYAQLYSIVMEQEKKMNSMKGMMKKAVIAPVTNAANGYAEMRKEFTDWRELFERELESEMRRKLQAAESRMLRVIHEEQRTFSSSADALRSLDATDPGILRVIEVAVQAVEIKKTGRVDHAALANGATVIYSERDLLYQDKLSPVQLFIQLIGLNDHNDDARFTSPSYRRAPAPYLGLLLSIGEIPWWLSRHNGRPETALSETMEIGSCWGFAGSSGRLSVKFALQIIADSITIDHIPAQIASDFSSAPNKFRVLGISGHPLRETVDFIPFGNFSYASNGPASQTFMLTPLQSQYSAIDGITLEVLSNHGHPDYTCLYRFRVHGQPV
ncbi:unnamed protein product [Peronospora belbahrii]|uniref:SUN domain-containing protein n=1 Tax=Peronospora belbahrii TaxID=622444 RepID=A0ABN8CYQ0_9STRA|nr:unnamed protein product [Peronospora belbahrii]